MRAGRAVPAYGVSPAFPDCREFRNDTRKRRGVFNRKLNEPRLENVQPHGGMPEPYGIGYALFLRNRLDFERTHQVMAGGGQELELVFQRAAPLAGQPLTVMSFWQQVLEETRPFPIGTCKPRIPGGGEYGSGCCVIGTPVA